MLGPAAASFSLCLLAILALRPIAIALKLIDRPGGRKQHHGEVPVVGGLAMLLGIVFGFGFVPLLETTSTPFLAACTLLVTVGLLDDRFDLSPWTRLAVHVIAALLLIGGSDVFVATLGTLFGTSEVWLDGFASYALTVLVVVAAINAFNILDGVDGLAGGMALVALSALIFLALDVGALVTATAALTVAGAVAGFLVANVPAHFNRDLRCFMGDAGSTLLGFAVASLCIVLSQYPVRAAAPATLLWIVALPLFDLFSTVIRRVLRGRSPLQADNQHLHHLVLRAGFGVRGTFAILVMLGASLAAFGIVLDRLDAPDWASLLLLLVTGVLVVRCLSRADRLHAWMTRAGLASASPKGNGRSATGA